MNYDNLNSYQRLQLYLKCEENNISFKKKRIKTHRWICIRHKCLLIAVDDPQCGELCCLKCPVDNDCEDFKKVLTKVKSIEL